jgi:hypothetical protein
VEAAGIEPASDGSDGDSEGESDLAIPDAGQSASESGHEVARNDDDLYSKHGPTSTDPPAEPEVTGHEPAG